MVRQVPVGDFWERLKEAESSVIQVEGSKNDYEGRIKFGPDQSSPRENKG